MQGNLKRTDVELVHGTEWKWGSCRMWLVGATMGSLWVCDVVTECRQGNFEGSL